jgi:hypothetical protein
MHDLSQRRSPGVSPVVSRVQNTRATLVPFKLEASKKSEKLLE